MVIFNNIILILEKYWGLFLQGIGVTLMLSAIAVVFGILIGSLLALMRLSKFHIGRFRPLDFIATIYVEIIRGTPLLLQLYFFFFLLPMMIPALETSAQFSITLALCLNSGAYVAEIIRGGIMAVDAGQDEAGRSLGLNFPQTMFCIVIPQALKNVLPALANEFIVLLKETSVACYVAVNDLTKGGEIIRSQTYIQAMPLLIVAALYLLMVVFFSYLVSKLERRLRSSDH